MILCTGGRRRFRLSLVVCVFLFVWKIDPLLFCVMFTRKGYIVSINKRGERLHPCVMPLVSENSSWSVWLTNNGFVDFCQSARFSLCFLFYF